jgi:hypothetical protein
MAFDVYPLAHTAPLNIGAGVSTPTSLSTERRSAELPNNIMYIRVAIIGSAIAPTFTLQAGAGDPVQVPSAFGIYDQPGNMGHYVGDSYLTPEANGVYLIKVLFDAAMTTASNWKLTIKNNDGAPRNFTFVVASSDGEARQSWIDMNTNLTATPFEVLITEAGAFTLRVFNYGTGDLTSLGGTLTGPDAGKFTFVAPVTPVTPNGLVDVPVKLAAVGSPATLSATLTVASNDPFPQVVATPSHNSIVAISGKVEQLEIAFMLDGSGSMAFSPGGSSIISTLPNNTRWGMLKSAAEAALTALGNHASGKGKFGVGVYPDITPFPAHASDAYGGPFPVPSPSAADFGALTDISVANIKAVADSTTGTLEQHFVREWGGATPMGAGIAHSIGPKDGTKPWGYFSSDPTAVSTNRRWLILMTDGNQNSGQDPSDFYAGAGSFQAKNIQVAAIGYGNPVADAGAAIIAPVNDALLKSIVTAGFNGTVTRYHFVNAADNTDLTTSFIKTLFLDGLQFDTTVDPGGVLTATNPTVSRQISISQYDRKLSFVVAWTTYNAQRLQVQVITPLGEVIEDVGHGYTIDFNPRFRMFTFDQDFLQNVAKPSQPRYGTWTLIITLNEIILQVVEDPAAAVDSEIYDYQVIVDSRLRLRSQLNQTTYAPGDSINVSALVTLDWLGIPNVSVTLSRVIPGTAHLNWLAGSAVTADEYNQVATAQQKDPDIDSLGIKQLALAAKGVRYTPVVNSDVVNMVDPDGKGIYVAGLANTALPGSYPFMITAVGALPDGTLFRREQPVNIELVVQPDPKFTIFHVDYGIFTQGGQTMTRATMTVRPLDRFGNVVLLDPQFDPSLLFTSTGGVFEGPIVDNHDGSYTRILDYPSGQTVGVGVIVGGVAVVPSVPLVNISGLTFVDKVFTFTLGREATPGANQHRDPNACLGNFTTKTPPVFVSLGGRGSIVVGYSDRHIVGQGGSDDITVFVAPDEQPRPYSVEVTSEDELDEWVEIGRSPGVTQSFGISQGSKKRNALAVRITDRSGRVRNNDGTPSSSPGVSILALGAKRVDEGDD